VHFRRLIDSLTAPDSGLGVIGHAPVVPLRQLIRRFWPYARPRRRWVALALVLTLLLPGIQTVQVWLFKALVDDVLVPRHFGAFWKIAGVYLLSALIEAGVAFAADLLSSWLSQRFLLDLRTDMFRHLQQLSLDFYERRRIGDLVSRLTNDIAGIESFLVSGFTDAVSYAVQVLVYATALFIIQWQLAFVALVSAPLFWFTAGHFSRLIKTASRERRRRSGSLSALAEETLGNVALIQAYNRQDWEVARFHREGEAKYAAEMAGARLKALYAPLVDVIELLGALFVMGFGAWQIARSGMSIGSFLAFLTFLTLLFSPIRGLSKLATSAYSATASAERVIDVMDDQATIVTPPTATVLPDPVGVIDVRGVSFTYPASEHAALHSVSLSVRPGEVLALVGASGAGKTTVTKLLLRFYDPDSGHICFDGVDLRQLDLASLRASMSVVLQETLVFDGTVRENIAYGRADATEADIQAAARAADAEEFISGLPLGYDTRIGERGRRLSGGQRQRIAIARAMVRDAPVLILDEPTTGLDAESGERVLEPLRRLMAGRSTIVVSHNLLTAREATEVVVFNRGRIVERGRHADLLRRGGAYARLYRLSGLAEVESPRSLPGVTALGADVDSRQLVMVPTTPGNGRTGSGGVASGAWYSTSAPATAERPGTPTHPPGTLSPPPEWPKPTGATPLPRRRRPRQLRTAGVGLATGVAAVFVVVGWLALRPGTPGSGAVGAPSGSSVSTDVRVVAKADLAGGQVLTVSVPSAARSLVLPASAFDVRVDGQPTPASVEPITPAPMDVAVVVDSTPAATTGARQAVSNGITELLPQLPAGSRIAVVGAAGPAVLQLPTADVIELVRAVNAVPVLAAAAAPGAAVRLAASAVATSPPGRRAVVVIGTRLASQPVGEVTNAALDSRLAGTAVYVLADSGALPASSRQILEFTGGTSYGETASTAGDSAALPLQPYDDLAADLRTRYRVSVPAASAAATVRVRLTTPTGTAGSSP
jgi:ATP-binding cassette subfamily B protein